MKIHLPSRTHPAATLWLLLAALSLPLVAAAITKPPPPPPPKPPVGSQLR